MLYITTLDNRDAYTAYRALHENAAPDGGLYVPFRLPEYTSEEIYGLKEKTFGQTVADLLNLFFSARLTDWDVDSCIGRTPIRTVSLNRKIYCSELWHNLESRYSYLESNLYSMIASGKDIPTSWAKIAIHVAILFGVYGNALQQEIVHAFQNFAVAVSVGDFTAPMAALYAKKMGLPIGSIILCSDDNSALWDLINRGEMGTSLLNPARKLGAQRLIQTCLGVDEAQRFQSVCQKHGVYVVSEEQLPSIATGLFAAVVGEDRANTTINSIYRTSQYLVTPQAAVCHAGLQDYRAKAGESCPTILLEYDSPVTCQKELQKATGLGYEDILRQQKGS